MTVAFTRGDVERMVKTFTANGTSEVTVTDPSVTAKSVIVIGLNTVGGTPNNVYLFSQTPGVGFSIKSAASNTSIYNYVVL